MTLDKFCTSSPTQQSVGHDIGHVSYLQSYQPSLTNPSLKIQNKIDRALLLANKNKLSLSISQLLLVGQSMLHEKASYFSRGVAFGD